MVICNQTMTPLKQLNKFTLYFQQHVYNQEKTRGNNVLLINCKVHLMLYPYNIYTFYAS